MSSASALLAAAEAQDRIAAKQRVGRHEHHEAAFENGERVPFISMGEVLRDVCEREEIPMHGPDYTLACRAVIEVLRVILGDTTKRDGHKLSRVSVGNRAICLAWILDQNLFYGSPSLRKLAERYGVSAAAFANYTSELRDKYGIANGSQLAHDHSRMHFNSSKPETVIDDCHIPEQEENYETKN